MAGMDSRTDPGVPDSVRKMEKVNQKSLPERTADAVMSMLHHENYGVGQKLPNDGGAFRGQPFHHPPGGENP